MPFRLHCPFGFASISASLEGDGAFSWRKYAESQAQTREVLARLPPLARPRARRQPLDLPPLQPAQDGPPCLRNLRVLQGRDVRRHEEAVTLALSAASDANRD